MTTTTAPATKYQLQADAAHILMAAEGVVARKIVSPESFGVFSYETTGAAGWLAAKWEIYSTGTEAIAARLPSGSFTIAPEETESFVEQINAANSAAWEAARANRPANPPATPSYARTVYAWAYAKAHYIANGIECHRCREGVTMQWRANTGLYRCDTCGRTYRPRVPHHQRWGR